VGRAVMATEGGEAEEVEEKRREEVGVGWVGDDEGSRDLEGAEGEGVG